MSTIDLIKEQIKSEIKVDQFGKGTASIRATARLCDVQHSSLLRAFEGGVQNKGKLAGMLTESGFDPGAFKDSGIPDLAVAIVVKYYANPAYSGQNSTDLARLVDLAFSAIGVRSWMQDTIGWKTPVMKEDATQCHILAREVAEQIAWIQSNVLDPAIAQSLISYAMQAIGAPVNLNVATVSAIAPVEELGCMEIARRLGHKPKDSDNKPLGTKCANVWRSIYGAEPKKKVQEINGRDTDVNRYPVDCQPILDAINSYFLKKIETPSKPIVMCRHTLASQMGVNRCTVYRWEESIIFPSTKLKTQYWHQSNPKGLNQEQVNILIKIWELKQLNKTNQQIAVELESLY